MMDIDQTQRRDIDDIQNNKVSLTIDNYNLLSSPFSKDLYDYMVDGYNWIKSDNKIFKYNLVENDKLVFHIDKIDELFEKIITNIKISFEIENGNNNFIFNGVNLVHDDIIKSKTFNEFINKRKMIFDCGTFNYSDLDFIVNDKGFDIELLFNGNKSNSMLALKNVKIIFTFYEKLQDEIDTVNNRVSNNFDFFVEDEDLIVSFNGVKREAEIPVEHINIKDIANLIYPVGSIYMSMNSVSPSILFGGEWEQIYDCFLLASGYSHLNGETGGSEDAVVVNHNHTQNAHTHTQNSHNHTQNAHSHRAYGNNNTYVVKEDSNGANNKRVTIVSSGSTYVDTASAAKFHNYNNTNNATATNKATTATNQNTTATNNPTGESGIGKNMPPYLTVNVWKRVK